MPVIRSAAEIARKWARVTPTRAEDYKEGIQHPKRDWEEMSVAAESAWSAGVQDAIARGARPAGIRRVGTSGWQKASVEKGPGRWSNGVQTAVDAYQRAMEEVVSVISATTLPPRGPKGDPRNLERVRVMVEALRSIKTRR